jgi:hypothetical protein
MNRMGGRKFVLSVIGVAAICVLAAFGKDVAAFGSIALIVTAYSGANSYIEGRHAPRDKSPE